jgi:hypothetical protein
MEVRFWDYTVKDVIVAHEGFCKFDRSKLFHFDTKPILELTDYQNL